METKKTKIEMGSSQLNLFFEEPLNSLSLRNFNEFKINSSNISIKYEKKTKIINFNKVITEKEFNNHEKTIAHILTRIKSF